MKKSTLVGVLVAALLVLFLFLFAAYSLMRGEPGGESQADTKWEKKRADSATSSMREKDVKDIPKATDTVNVLAVGVDYSEELTDVIMYARYNPKTDQAQILSIPRDTFIGDEYDTGKINQVYKATGSIGTLVDLVEERFHLPVDYYAMITLDELGEVVDLIGGVEITLDRDLYDLGVKQFSAGTQTINGDQAQIFVRLRKAYPDADLGRINAQHDFMMAVMKKVQSLGLLKTLDLVMNCVDMVQTDMPISKVVSFAASAYNITEEDIEFFTVPGMGKMNYSYAVYEVDEEALAEMLNDVYGASVSAEELEFPQAYSPPAPSSAAEEEASDWDDEDPEEEDRWYEEEEDPGEDYGAESSSSQTERKAKKVPRDEENGDNSEETEWRYSG